MNMDHTINGCNLWQTRRRKTESSGNSSRTPQKGYGEGQRGQRARILQDSRRTLLREILDTFQVPKHCNEKALPGQVFLHQ